MLLLLVCIKANSLSFETERTRKIYELLPNDVRLKIDSAHSNRCVDWGDSSKVVVLYNDDKQLSHIGINLMGDSFVNPNINGAYLDAYRFLEYCLLNLNLLNDKDERLQFAEKMQLKFYFDNKPEKLSGIDIQAFTRVFDKLDFALTFNDYFFQASWKENAGREFSIRFPTALYLLKGMDKVELESSFINNLKQQMTVSDSFDFRFKTADRLAKDLFVVEGERFETDNFRSDIYLKKAKSSFYEPVFSEQYPVESFSNLFVCGINNSFEVDVCCYLYKGKKVEKHSLNNLQLQLSINKKVYFGLYSNSATTIKATVIYYDPVYKYIHMLVIEGNRNTLFSNENANLKADLYLYIPRSDIDKENIIKNV